MNRFQSIAEFTGWQTELGAAWDETAPGVRVCDGTGCRALGSQKVLAALREEVAKRNQDTPIDIVGTGCPGFCECGPLMTVLPQRISYQKVKTSDVPEIVEQTLIQGKTVERLLYTDPQTGEHIRLEPDLPFYQKQKRLVLDLNGQIDPTKLEEYVARGGYSSLAQRPWISYAGPGHCGGPELRPARAWRRGILNRHQVATVPRQRQQGRRGICGVQCRRR